MLEIIKAYISFGAEELHFSILPRSDNLPKNASSSHIILIFFGKLRLTFSAILAQTLWNTESERFPHSNCASNSDSFLRNPPVIWWRSEKKLSFPWSLKFRSFMWDLWSAKKDKFDSQVGSWETHRSALSLSLTKVLISLPSLQKRNMTSLQLSHSPLCNKASHGNQN